jgi:NAD(P)-dependent dehydrogenase (short-subunit alcohol dehydrogenase family)
VVGDIDPAAAKATADEITASGGRASGVELDGADDESIAAIVALATSRFGGLDGFHANFASFKDGTSGEDVLGLPMETFDEVMRVNMRGFVLCTRHAVPAMIARGGGSILYTSSAASYMGQPVRLAYAMSKLAVHALMRHVATRFGRDGIRANALTPGTVTHPRFEATMPREFVEQTIATTPRGRLGLPADVAAMAALLMSDEGNFITGQLISVDGGKTMRQ